MPVFILFSVIMNKQVIFIPVGTGLPLTMVFFLDFLLKYFQVLYLVTIAWKNKLLTNFFEVRNVGFFFFFPWCYCVLVLRMVSLSVISFQLLHIKCDNDEHMFQRPSTFFWCNNEDSPPCLDISSITLTPRSSPDSRLSSGLLIPPPSKSGLPKPTSEYSCPRPRVILLCKSFLCFGFLFFWLSFVLCCVLTCIKNVHFVQWFKDRTDIFFVL